MPHDAQRPPAPSNSSSRGSSRSRWDSRPLSTSTERTTTSIHAQGFTTARKDVGRRITNEMEMLLSPSRGVQAGKEAETLMNPTVQDRFRLHIEQKLKKLDEQEPLLASSSCSNKRREELNTILLDFRKLREGVTSSRRMDAFTIEVYESSVLYAIKAANWSQLSACLPHLVLDIYPARQTPCPVTLNGSVVSSLASLSLSPSPADRSAFFASLYLLHLVCAPQNVKANGAPSPFAAFLSAYTTLPVHVQSSSHVLLAQQVYTALLTTNYIAFYRLLVSLGDRNQQRRDRRKDDDDDDERRADLNRFTKAIMTRAIPALRTRIWTVLVKVYKMPKDLEWRPHDDGDGQKRDADWLARALCFDSIESGNESMRDLEAFLADRKKESAATSTTTMVAGGSGTEAFR